MSNNDKTRKQVRLKVTSCAAKEIEKELSGVVWHTSRGQKFKYIHSTTSHNNGEQLIAKGLVNTTVRHGRR